MSLVESADTLPSVILTLVRATVAIRAGGEPLTTTGKEDTNRHCKSRASVRGTRCEEENGGVSIITQLRTKEG